MDPVYKYLPKKYALSLINEGRLKIGTLHDYRKVDKYGENIGDSEEGMMHERVEIKEASSQEELHPLAQRVFKIGGGSKIINSTATEVYNSDDVYIFSVSRIFDVPLMRKISADYNERYDICIKIFDPVSFLKAVSDVLKELLVEDVFKSCHYKKRVKHPDDKTEHPAFIKDPKYNYQFESRMVWATKSREISPLILSIPEVKNFCELLYEDTIEFPNPESHCFKNLTFTNDVIKMDGASFFNCKFLKCQFVYFGERVVIIEGCEFKECVLHHGGGATNTLEFMKWMRNDLGSAGKDMIKNWFNHIQG